MLKLLSATPSPYARKVRIALAEKGLPFELITEVPWNADTSTPKLNPLEKLPVLILEDGSTVFESSFILEYLETKHPEPRLFPRDPEQRLVARRFEVLADGVCDAIVLTVVEAMRPETQRSTAWRDRQMRKIIGGLGEIAHTVPGDGFCVGAHFSIADIAVGTVLGYVDVRCPEVDWRARHPNLIPAFTRLSERPSFQATVPTVQKIAGDVV
jgi:glutathione S-transferase